MCGRYYTPDDDEALMRIVAAIRNGKTAGGDIYPSSVAPALARNGPEAMRWGFSLRGGTGLIINARSETAGQKPMFRAALKDGRCLLPAGHYYEWQTAEGKKIKHSFGAPDGSLIYMAGLFRPGEELNTFVILTRSAPPLLATVHERMPIILPPEARKAWLSGENADAVFAAADTEMSDISGASVFA